MSPETFAAVVGAIVGGLISLIAVVLGAALTPVVEWWRRERQVKALKAVLREHFLSAVGVIAQKRELAKAIADAFNHGGTPEGYNVPCPIDAIQRVDMALGEDLSVRERHLVAHVLALFTVIDQGVVAGLGTTGNEMLSVRQAAMSKVGSSLKALDDVEDLVTRYLKDEVVDVTLRDQTAGRFPS